MADLAPTRRAVLAGLAVAAFAPAPLAFASVQRLRSVEIDVGPLAAKGVPRYAARVRATLAPLARTTFAPRLAPSDKTAPTLVVVVESIMMASYAGGGGGGRDRFGWGFGRDTPYDWITGAGVVVDPKRKLLARHPITASRDAAEGGPWYLVEESEQRRLENLCQSLVYWIERAL